MSLKQQNPLSIMKDNLRLTCRATRFTWLPLIAWGDPVVKGASAFDFENQSALAQEGQFGYNNDYTALLRGIDEKHATLVCNNEYTNDELMFAAFRHSVGVANIARFLPQIQTPPRYVTNGERGAGFAEVARALMAAH